MPYAEIDEGIGPYYELSGREDAVTRIWSSARPTPCGS